jgi:ABC-2 type transport system permease protein
MVPMRKFLAFTKSTWQLTLAYRGESLVWFMLELIPLFIILSFWNSLLISEHLSQTQFSQLTLYYFITLLISRLTSVHFEDWVIDEIRDGKISKYLLKPFSYQIYLLAHELTWRVSGLVYLLPTLLIFFPVLLKLHVSPPSFIQLLACFTLLFFAFIQRFFLGFIIGNAAFWFDQSKSLVHAKWMCEGIFGGAWLPLYFFPLWLQSVAKFTPFYSWFFYPIELLLKPESLTSFLSVFPLTIFWTLSLWLVSQVIWRLALRKYTAVGN